MSSPNSLFDSGSPIQPQPGDGQVGLSEKMLLLLLSAVQFTHIMDFMVMMPLGQQLMRIFTIEPSQFSLLVASYTFSAGIAGVAGALLIDRYDRKKAMLFCYAGFILGTLSCALSPNYESLLVARVVSGAFGGVSGAMVLTIVGDVIPPQRRAGAMGIIMASFAVASVVGVPAGLWLAAHFNWHAPFYVIVAVGIVIWLLCLYKLPVMRSHMNEGQRAGAQILSGLKEILTSRNSLIALSFMTLMVFGHFIIIPFVAPSLVSNAGLEEKELSWFYLAGGIASLITSPFIGRLADRYGKFRLFAITIIFAMPTVYILTNQGEQPLWAIMILSALFFAFGAGRFIPGQAIMTSAVPAHLRGSFMSLNTSVRDLAAGVASIIGGHIVVKEVATGRLLHFSVLGWIAIAASVLSIFVAMRVKPVA